MNLTLKCTLLLGKPRQINQIWKCTLLAGKPLQMSQSLKCTIPEAMLWKVSLRLLGVVCREVYTGRVVVVFCTLFRGNYF